MQKETSTTALELQSVVEASMRVLKNASRSSTPVKEKSGPPPLCLKFLKMEVRNIVQEDMSPWAICDLGGFLRPSFLLPFLLKMETAPPAGERKKAKSKRKKKERKENRKK